MPSTQFTGLKIWSNLFAFISWRLAFYFWLSWLTSNFPDQPYSYKHIYHKWLLDENTEKLSLWRFLFLTFICFSFLSCPFSRALSLDFLNLASSSIADMREPKLAAEIAKQLHKFHRVDIPGSKEPQLWNDIFKFYENGIFSDSNLLPWFYVS